MGVKSTFNRGSGRDVLWPPSIDTVQNLGGLMRHGETGDGPIAQQSCDRC
jgi:hypothetical protein